MKTLERINELAAERARLFREGTNGQKGNPQVMMRIAIIDQELDRLWDQRRAERAGRAEGIDRLIERSYEQVYGREEELTSEQRRLLSVA